MKELPTPTYPFSLLDLPMGSLPHLAPRNHALVASIRSFWSQLTGVAARQTAAPDSTSR